MPSSKPPTSEELQERLRAAGKILRTREYAGFFHDQLLEMARSSTRYTEAVAAVVLDSMNGYIKAAEKDRESQARNRRAQNALTLAMVLLTLVIAISTALYTLAAWKGLSPASPQPSMPGQVRNVGTSPAPDTAQ
jgi:hypothetical protein